MEKQIFLQDSPSFVDLCTLHQHAMRYYRLWIYTCNTVLALATLVFTVFAVSVLVDPRITLLSGVELYQPTFLYAYVALLLQCGVLQAIGCIGALRLNQKLLNTYWTLLLVLMIGDIIVGLVWAFRLDRIKSTLKPNLKIRLSADYGTDPDFTEVWDWLQSHEMCCGVERETDFHHPNDMTSLNNHYDANGRPYETTGSPLPKLPSTCCTFSDQLPVTTPSSVSSGSHPSKDAQLQQNIQGQGSGSGSGSVSRGGPSHRKKHNRYSISSTTPTPVHTTTKSSNLPFLGSCTVPAHLAAKTIVFPTPSSFSKEFGSGSGSGDGSGSESSEGSSSSMLNNGNEITSAPKVNSKTQSTWHPGSSPWPVSSTTSTPMIVKPHRVGCGDKVLEWLDHATDVLFVIGFCIIVFLKGCFLTILRYEIKEMIQKIRMMNGEDPNHTAAMNELIGLTSLYENGDGGEGEELMATAVPVDNTSNTNVDDMESDKFLRKSDGHRGSTGSGGLLSLVRSSGDTEDLIGNNVNATVKRSYYGNHISTSISSSTPATASTKHEIEDDFDSSSALLGRYDSAGRKFRNQNGGRPLPRNGNNNSTTTIPSSTSAPIPIETVATVNSSAC